MYRILKKLPKYNNGHECPLFVVNAAVETTANVQGAVARRRCRTVPSCHGTFPTVHPALLKPLLSNATSAGRLWRACGTKTWIDATGQRMSVARFLPVHPRLR
jgi:hypothetical protein